VIRYISRVAEGISRQDILSATEAAAPEVKEAIMTLAEQWIQEGELKASEADLDVWAERVLTAASLEEVFRP
jgi:hypothetical protein